MDRLNLKKQGACGNNKDIIPYFMDKISIRSSFLESKRKGGI